MRNIPLFKYMYILTYSPCSPGYNLKFSDLKKHDITIFVKKSITFAPTVFLTSNINLKLFQPLLIGTFKLKKVEYRKEGFNPSTISDRLFYLDARAGLYKPLTPEAYSDINMGKIKL